MRYLLFVLLLSGCATLGKPETFAGCAAFDTATTGYGLHTKRMHEADPLARDIGGTSAGGQTAAVALMSIGAYYLLRYVDNPNLTAVASGLTCASATRNLWLAR